MVQVKGQQWHNEMVAQHYDGDTDPRALQKPKIVCRILNPKAFWQRFQIPNTNIKHSIQEYPEVCGTKAP